MKNVMLLCTFIAISSIACAQTPDRVVNNPDPQNGEKGTNPAINTNQKDEWHPAAKEEYNKLIEYNTPSSTNSENTAPRDAYITKPKDPDLL